MIHGITSARYTSPAPPDGHPSDAPVVAMRNGIEEYRQANDSIDGGGMLAYIAGGGTIAPYVAPTLTTEQLIAYAASKRWSVMTAGVPIGGGVIVDSSNDSLSLITGTIESLERGWISAPVKFKAATGWVDLTLAQIQAIAAAISQHTQACFVVEESVVAGITADPPTITSKSQVDAASWPANA